MNSNDSSRQAWATGVASILVMGGALILPSAAQADQLAGDAAPSASRFYSGLRHRRHRRRPQGRDGPGLRRPGLTTRSMPVTSSQWTQNTKSRPDAGRGGSRSRGLDLRG
jgi:hypothetical protein